MKTLLINKCEACGEIPLVIINPITLTSLSVKCKCIYIENQSVVFFLSKLKESEIFFQNKEDEEDIKLIKLYISKAKQSINELSETIKVLLEKANKENLDTKVLIEVHNEYNAKHEAFLKLVNIFLNMYYSNPSNERIRTNLMKNTNINGKKILFNPQKSVFHNINKIIYDLKFTTIISENKAYLSLKHFDYNSFELNIKAGGVLDIFQIDNKRILIYEWNKCTWIHIYSLINNFLSPIYSTKEITLISLTYIKDRYIVGWNPKNELLAYEIKRDSIAFLKKIKTSMNFSYKSKIFPLSKEEFMIISKKGSQIIHFQKRKKKNFKLLCFSYDDVFYISPDLLFLGSKGKGLWYFNTNNYRFIAEENEKLEEINYNYENVFQFKKKNKLLFCYAKRSIIYNHLTGQIETIINKSLGEGLGIIIRDNFFLNKSLSADLNEYNKMYDNSNNKKKFFSIYGSRGIVSTTSTGFLCIWCV